MEILEQDHLSLPLNAGSCPLDSVPKLFSHLKILHINARDLRVNGKLSELEHMACAVNVDVICVSETFLTLIKLCTI